MAPSSGRDLLLREGIKDSHPQILCFHESLPDDQMLWVFEARETKRFKPVSYCVFVMEVLFSFGVWGLLVLWRFFLGLVVWFVGGLFFFFFFSIFLSMISLGKKKESLELISYMLVC